MGKQAFLKTLFLTMFSKIDGPAKIEVPGILQAIILPLDGAVDL